MYDRSRKKFRSYRRECRRLLGYVQSITPNYQPDAPYRNETIKLYANLFFRPKGRDRRQLLQALLIKTEDIAAHIPDGLPFCRVLLTVFEENPARSEIILFYDEREYNTFRIRKDIRYQKWSVVSRPSLAESMGLRTTLSEQCCLEEVRNEEDNYRRCIWFYEQ